MSKFVVWQGIGSNFLFRNHSDKKRKELKLQTSCDFVSDFYICPATFHSKSTVTDIHPHTNVQNQSAKDKSLFWRCGQIKINIISYIDHSTMTIKERNLFHKIYYTVCLPCRYQIVLFPEIVQSSETFIANVY